MAKRKSPTDQIVITKGGSEATVVRSSFEKVWKEKGWTVKEEGAVNQTQATGTSAKDQPKSKTEDQPKG